MTLKSLVLIHDEERQKIEARMADAQNTLTNLDRQAQEYFATIDRRAAEDKEAIAALFLHLTTMQELVIAEAKAELGIEAPPVEQDEPVFETVPLKRGKRSN